MRVPRALACAAFAAACTLPVLAQDADHKPTYHEHFATCAHESKGLRGEEHQRFMSECLKDHGWAPSTKAGASRAAGSRLQFRSCWAEPTRGRLQLPLEQVPMNGAP